MACRPRSTSCPSHQGHANWPARECDVTMSIHGSRSKGASSSPNNLGTLAGPRSLFTARYRGLHPPPTVPAKVVRFSRRKLSSSHMLEMAQGSVRAFCHVGSDSAVGSPSFADPAKFVLPHSLLDALDTEACGPDAPVSGSVVSTFGSATVLSTSRKKSSSVPASLWQQKRWVLARLPAGMTSLTCHSQSRTVWLQSSVAA